MTRVIKIGGRPQSDPSLAAAIARAVARDASLVLVHGGGDEASALQAMLGGSTRFVDGRRVTTEKDIDIVRMALSGSANKRLVSALVDRGVRAIGISGEDAGLIGASPMDADKLGFVGEPQVVDVALLRHLFAGGYVPVVSPVSRDANGTMGHALNVNGDDAAAAIAVALGASELLLVADVEGVLSDATLIPRLTVADAERLVGNGTARGGMQAKVQAGIAAIRGGVARVRISDIAAIDDLTRGTVLRATGENE